MTMDQITSLAEITRSVSVVLTGYNQSGLLRFYGPDKAVSLVRKAFGGLQPALRQETGDQAVKLTNRSMSQTADTRPMP
jgi:hypothetical protein